MHCWVTGLVLEATRAQSMERVGSVTCRAIAARQPSPALVRIWVNAPGRELRLLASAGSPIGGGSYERLDGAFGVITNPRSKISRIAATAEPMTVRGVRGDEEWLSNPGWIARQGVRSFAGLPLVADGTVLGVLAVFERTRVSEELLGDLQFVAEFAAARLAALRDPAVAAPAPVAPLAGERAAIIPRAELRALERRSIEAALAQCNWKIFGSDGAAAVLGMKPTTLASRIKALGIESRHRGG